MSSTPSLDYQWATQFAADQRPLTVPEDLLVHLAFLRREPALAAGSELGDALFELENSLRRAGRAPSARADVVAALLRVEKAQTPEN